MEISKKTTSQEEYYFSDFLYQESESLPEESDLYSDFLKILDNEKTDLIESNKARRKRNILDLIEKYITNSGYREEIKNRDITEPEMSSQSSKSNQNITIGKLEAKNFRGFKASGEDNNREISFQQKSNIFYAPNGGGKSSLCEAIEWCLTGTTTEYGSRGETKKNYFQHDETKTPSYEETTLYNYDGDEFQQNPDYFSKCFIEKNRIESFGRLSVQRKQHAEDLISTLFGFRPLSDFFDKFVKPNQFKPTTSYLKSNPNSNWSEWKDYEDSKEDARQRVNEIEDKAQGMVNSLQNDCGFTIDDPNIEDISLAEKLEIIEKNFNKLTNRLGVLRSHELEKVLRSIGDVRDILKEINELNGKLEVAESDVDAHTFYDAAQDLMKDYGKSKCPLCETPFEGGSNTVVTNPKDKINEELEKLTSIEELKNQKEDKEDDLRELVKRINRSWERFWRENRNNEWLLRYFEFQVSEQEPGIDDIKDLLNYQNIKDKSKKAKNQVDNLIELLSKSIDNMSQNENTLTNLCITIWFKDNKNKVKKIGNLKKELENAKKRLKKLEDQDENANMADQMLNQYDSFIESFKNYKNDLSESENINDLTSALYRIFNLHDTDAQKVEKIQLPETHDGSFTIKFENRDNGSLSSLSEGHLKVLGLSILLARAQEHTVPFIVFDDVVNAIDSDHRNNIARFLSGRLSQSEMEEAFDGSDELREETQDFIDDLQLIITTHDRFFDEQISNKFDGDDIKHYVLYYGNEGVIPVDRAANFENRIEHFRSEDVRDLRSALMYARLALEEFLVKQAEVGISNCECDPNKEHKSIKFAKTIQGDTKMLDYVSLSDLLQEVKDAHYGCNNGKNKIGDACKEILDWDNVPWLQKIIDQEHHYLNRGRFYIEDADVGKMEIGKIIDTIKKIKPELS